jgi:hypothetical protein
MLGNHRIASLTEQTAMRSVLDDCWDSAVNYMLEQGLWNFALRTVELDFDTNVEPLFGYKYGFSKPADWVRTQRVCDFPTLNSDFERWHDEAAYWYADPEKLFITYVSNLPNYGWNIGAWRQHFCKALEAYLAFEAAIAIPDDKGSRSDLFQLYKRRLADAKIKDAADEEVEYAPRGRLIRSRYGYGSRTYTRYR